MATNMHFGASKTIFQYAELLRKSMTTAEKIIWERLCKNQLGIRIRRQHPIYKYIADYYCHELKLVIEIDGDIHLLKESKEYDISRDVTLNELGIQILRFTNQQVINNTDKVIEEIKKKIEELKLKQILQLQKIPEAGKSPLGDLGAIHKIKSFHIAAPYTLQIVFEDNSCKTINFFPVLNGEMFGLLRDPEYFNQVILDTEVNTIVWPNGADFDPALLYNWDHHINELTQRAKKWDA